MDELDDYERLIDESSKDEAEADMKVFAIQAMLKFHLERIMELETLGLGLAGNDLAHRLGLYLVADAKAHRQVHEWASRVLNEPVPDWKTQAALNEPVPDWKTRAAEYGRWITCLRVFRRHVAAWEWHQDFWVNGDELLKQMANEIDHLPWKEG